MLLIHTPRLTNRLGYTLNVIFRHILHMDFSITTDAEHFGQYGGAKLSYGRQKVGEGLFVKSNGLLFRTSIEEQEPRCCQIDGQWILFPTHGRDIDLPFDIFSAAFFMVSRYEEYLPHREDMHRRFNATESLAFREGFLEEPVVEQWAMMLREKLAARYPDLALPDLSYRFVQTVDIDAAWSYLHKGFFRSTLGLFRDLLGRRDIVEVRRRIRVLLHREEDPFDTFDYIISSWQRVPDAYLLFFTLLADYDQYDKPVGHSNPYMRQLVQHLGDYAKMGIHPGYYSMENPKNVDIEEKRLEEILHRAIVRSRYHFLRLQLPLSYRILLHSGIRHDYTMGFADAPGFRAGISTEFPFYDLERDLETELMIHPFCVMDTTLQKYLRLTPGEALARYRTLIDSVRKVNGTFSCIVHNQNLCELYGWEGWRHTYEGMLAYAKP